VTRALLVFALLASGCGARPAAAGTLLAPGAAAPDFMALDQEGAPRALRLLRGRRPMVLFFYPRDGTPGCTEEACAFRDAWSRLTAAGAVVVGVSTDDVAAHRRFAQEHQLPFPLLSDPDGEALALYGVPTRMGMAARVTFVIDRQGRVARVFPDVDPAVHVGAVVSTLEGLEPTDP